MSDRTFKIQSPQMQGGDVNAWREFLIARFAKWNIPYPLHLSGPYDVSLRAATATFLRAWGASSAAEAMEHGVSPWWRVKVRNDRRSVKEAALFLSPARVAYRRALRERYKRRSVAVPVGKVLADSWGWHPGVHDGLDLICPPSSPLLAICDGEIVRVAAGGWWGLGAPADPALRSKGDGVIILRSTVDVGPIKRGLNFVYGHAEGATVKAGQNVKAGQMIGHAGFANAWHVHLCVNGRDDTLGVGDRDPRPFYDYARKHG